MFTNNIKKLLLVLLSLVICTQTLASNYVHGRQTGTNIVASSALNGNRKRSLSAAAKPLVVRAQSGAPSSVEIDATKFSAVANDRTSNDYIVITATLRDASGIPVPFANVTWKTDGAVIADPRSSQTNELGQASVQLSSAEALTAVLKLTVNNQFEFDTGKVITFSRPGFAQVHGSGLTISSDQIIEEDILVTGTFEITGTAVVTLVGQRLIQATDVLIGPQARLSADGTGHAGGRGASAGWPKQESATGGGGHGGHGGQGSLHPSDSDPSWPGAPYGSVGQPERMGSSGGVRAGNLACPGRGGGAIRLIAAQTITIEGVISANGSRAQPGSACGGGAGGSIWLTAARYAGSGTVTANGGDGDVTTYDGVDLQGGGGGGGRVALHGLSAQLPQYSIQAAAGANGLWAGEPGTALYIAPIDQLSSGLELERSVLYADGLDAGLITVTLRTADGEPIAGRPIVMKVAPAIEGIWLDNQEAGWWNGGEVRVGLTDEQGQRAVAIRSNQLGTVSITARTLDGVVLAPDLRVAFVTTLVTTLRPDGIIASGWGHVCAIKTFGALYCWGLNDYGQVGDGTITGWSTVMVTVTDMGSDVTAVSAGWLHTCAIKNGALYCWGDNARGQLGDGTTTLRSTPAAVQGMDSGVTSVVAGRWHTCAIKNEALYCWGRNDHGQLGDGTRIDRLTPVAVQGMESGVTAAAVGGYHTCAIKSGALYCWGWNLYGQLGDGTRIDRLTPVAVNGMARHVAAVAAPDSDGYAGHTCAIKAGALYCWGWNGYGQLGDGTTTNRLTPVAVQGMESGVTAVAVGEFHSCAVMNGALYCWGRDDVGELGNGVEFSSSSRPSAVLDPMTSNVTVLAAGGANALGLRSDSCLYYWGWPYGLLATGSWLMGTPFKVSSECTWAQPFPPSGLLFGKAAPMSGTTGLPITTTLAWNVPLTGTVDHYRYCYGPEPHCTVETPVSNATTSVVISGLLPGVTYYWQVRACITDDCEQFIDANGSSGHWSFSVRPLPAQNGFNKRAPTNGATDVFIIPTLSWAPSADATHYEVCYDTMLNGACDATWQNVGSTLSTTLSRLAAGVDYEWQVRACDDAVGCNAGANGGTWWLLKARDVSAVVSPSLFYLGQTTTYSLENLPPSQAVVLTAQYPGLIKLPNSQEEQWESEVDLAATDSGVVEVIVGAAAPGPITLTAVSGSSVIAVTTATVVAGPVTSVQLDTFPRPLLANGEDSLALTITVLGGSPVRGLPARTVVITSSDDLILSPTVAQTDRSGVIVAQLRANQALTTAQLTVTVLPTVLGDTLTEDVSADVLFVVPSINGVSAVSSTVESEATATSFYADGTTVRINAWVRDVSGRPAPHRPVDLIIVPDPWTGTGYRRVAGSPTDASGKAAFAFPGSYTGTYTLWGIVHEVGFSTPITISQPFTVTLIPGPVYSSLSRLHVHQQPAFAGSGVTVTVVLTGALGRRVQGAQTRLRTPNNSVEITPALASTNWKGEASFLVKRNSPGTVVISGDFKQPLDPEGSNWKSLQSDLSLTFLPPFANPHHSFFRVQPAIAKVPADGQSSITVSLLLHDGSGYPVLHDKPVVFTHSGGSSVIMSVPSGLVTATNGTASINLRNSVPQTVVVSAWLPDEQVTVTQRITIEFVAFNTDPDRSSIEVERPVGFASLDRPLAVTVTLRDDQGRIVPLNNVSLAANGSNVSVSNDPFQMRWRVGTTQAQTITLRAVDTTVGVTLTQAPTISFVPGPVNGRLSLLSVNRNQVAADGYQTSTAVAILRDSLGRPLAGYPVRLTASSLNGDNSAVLFVAPSFTQLSDANGQVTFYLSATRPSRWSIALLDLVNQDLGYTALTFPFPYNVIFYGRLDSAATTLQASKNLALAYGHEPVTLTLQLRDSAGSTVSGVPVTFTTATEGVTLTQAASTSNSQGIVQARVSKHTPGNVTVSAVLPSGEVIKQISITFYSLSLWKPYSQITVPNPIAVANGEDRVVIQAVLRGLDNAPAAGRPMRLIASGSHVTFPDSSVRTTNARGEISFTVASTKAEFKFLQIEDTLFGDSIPVGHVVFEPSTFSVSRSHVLVEDTPGTGEVRLTVILRDAHDNPIPNKRVRIESTRPVSIAAPARSNSGGALVALITSNAVQTTSLSVYVEDVFLGNRVVRFFKGASSAHSRLTSSAPVITADGISTLVLTAELRSNTGEPLVNMPVRLEIFSSGRSADFTFQISPSHQLHTDSSGMARFFVSTVKAGTAEIILKDDILRDLTIARTTVVFTPGTPHPALSSFHLMDSDTQVVREWLDAEVTLRDRYGNLVMGRPVSIQIEGRDLQFASQRDVQILDGYYVMTTTTSQDGKATFSFSSPTVQQITMTAWHGGQRIGRVLRGAFLNAPDPNLSVLEVSMPGQATADGISAISVTLRLFDANGYPIVGLPIRPALLNLPQNAYRVQPLPIITTGSDGRAQFSVTSIRAGVFPLQVWDNAYGRLIAQGTLTYTAGPISLAASQLTVSPPFPQPADGLTPYKVTVIARDDSGNLLEGVSVQVETLPQQGVVVTQPQEVTDASGRASAYVVGTTRTPILLTARVNGRLISATTQVRFYSPDLRVASASIHPLHFGGKAIYGIEVANSGVLAARQAYLEVMLDPRLSYVDQSSTAAFTSTGRVLRWSFGDLSEGETRFVRLVLDASQAELGDTVLVTSSVGALNGDEDDSDNTAVARATVVPHRDFEVALREPVKFVGGGEGSAAVYALFITNTGASTDVFTVHARLNDTHNSSLGLTSVVTPANGFSVSVRAGEAVLLPVVLRLNGCEREGEHTFEVVVSSSDGKVKKVNGSLVLSSQPSLVDLHPGDGFVAVGREAVFTWATHSADARGALIIERMDSTGFGAVYSSTVTPIEEGLLRHTAVVSSLVEGATYRWRVQLIGACAQTESAPSSLRMERAVVLEGPTRVEIERDYNQPIAFVLTNKATMPRLVSVTAEALNGADEFILGFVGSGSPDQAVVLAPGASRAITLMLHAQHATASDYKILLQASSRPYQSPDAWASFNTVLDVRVRQLVVSYTLTESYNPKTMIRTYRLTNHGSPLTDLRVDARSESDGVDWLTYPTLQNAYLGTGQSITFEMVPVIETDEITSAVVAAATMKGRFKLSAAGTTLREVAVPPSPPPASQSLFRARIDGGLRIEAASADYYCTNRPNITLRLDTPGLNSNYSDHELKLSFWPRSDVRPHDLSVRLNKFPVLSLVNSVPSGEYREKVSPLFINSSGVQGVQIRTKHMNEGHYVVASGVKLVSCADSFERWVYAGSQAEADAAARSLSFIKPSSGGSGRFQIQQLVRGEEVHEGDTVRVVATLIGDPLPSESKVYLRATGTQFGEMVEMERRAGYSSEYVAVIGPVSGLGPLKLTVSTEACNYQSDSVLLSVVPPLEPGGAFLAKGSTFEVAPKIVFPDGRSKATITLTLRSDRDYSIIPGARVWLYDKPLSRDESSPALGEVLSVTGRTNAQGQFTATMTSMIPGEFYITADDLDRQIKLGRGILVRFGSTGVIRTNPRSVRSNGMDSITITVRTLEHSSDMSGTVIQLSTEPGSVGQITPQVVVLNSSGVATAFITSTEPGIAVIRAMAVVTDGEQMGPEGVISSTTAITQGGALVGFARSQGVYFGDIRQLASLSVYPTLVEVSQTAVITLAVEVPDIASTGAVITTSRPSADHLSTTQGRLGHREPLVVVLTSSLPGDSVVTAQYFDPINELTRTLTQTVTFASSLRVLSLTLSPSPTIYFSGQMVSVTGYITGSDLHLYDNKLQLVFVSAPITSSERFSSPKNFGYELRMVDAETKIEPNGRFSFSFRFKGMPGGYVAVGALYAMLPLERNRADSPRHIKLLHLLQGDIVVNSQRPTVVESVQLTSTQLVTRVPSMQAWFAVAGQPITITTRSVVGTAPYTNHPSAGLPVSASLEHIEGGTHISSLPLTTDARGRASITFTPELTGLHHFKLKHLVPIDAQPPDDSLLLADRVYVAPQGSTCVGLPAITSYTSNYKFTRDAVYPAAPSILPPAEPNATFTLQVDWKRCTPGKVILGVTRPGVTPEELERADRATIPFYFEFYREYPVLNSRRQITLENTFNPMGFNLAGNRHVYIVLVSDDGMRSNYILAPYRTIATRLIDIVLLAAGLSDGSDPSVPGIFGSFPSVPGIFRSFFAQSTALYLPAMSVRDRRTGATGSVPGVMYAVVFPHPADDKVSRVIPTLFRMIWPKRGEPPRNLSHKYDRDHVREFKADIWNREKRAKETRTIKLKRKPLQYFEFAVPFVCDSGPSFSFMFMRTWERGGVFDKTEFDVKEFYDNFHSKIKDIPGAKAAYANLTKDLKNPNNVKAEQSSLKAQWSLKFHIGAKLGPVFCGNRGQMIEGGSVGPIRAAFDVGFIKKWNLLPILVRLIPGIGIPLGGALGFACEVIGVSIACGPEAYLGFYARVKTKIELPLEVFRGEQEATIERFLNKFWLGLALVVGIEYALDKLLYFNAELSLQPGVEFKIPFGGLHNGFDPTAGIVEVEAFAKVAVMNSWATEFFVKDKLILWETPNETEVDVDEGLRQVLNDIDQDGVTLSATADDMGDDSDEEGALDAIPMASNIAADNQNDGTSLMDVSDASGMVEALQAQLASLSDASPHPSDVLDVRQMMTQVLNGRYTLLEALLSMAPRISDGARLSASVSPLSNFRLIPPTGKGDPTYARFVASESPAAFSLNHPLAVQASIGADATVTSVLVSNVFTYSQPALASDPSSGRVIMVWSHDRSDGPRGGSRELMYSVWDGARWSAARLITFDGLSDDSPSVVWGAHGKAVLVWVRAKQLLSDQIDLSPFEIATAEYDPMTDTWSDIRMLTKNDSADVFPMVARGEDGTAILAWTALDASGVRSIRTRLWQGDGRWGPIQTAWLNAPGVFDLAHYRNGDSLLVGTQRLVPTGLTTATHQVFVVRRSNGVWGQPNQVTRLPVDHLAPTVVYDRNGLPVIGWISGDRIHLKRFVGAIGDIAASRVPADVLTMASPSGFKLLRAPNGNLLALVKSSTPLRGLYVLHFDYSSDHHLSLLGEPKRVNGLLESAIGADAVVDNSGRLLAGYVRLHNQEVTRTLEYSPPKVITDVVPVRADLVTLAHYVGRRLALSHVQNDKVGFDLTDEGVVVTATVAVWNRGDVAENVNGSELRVAFFADNRPVGLVQVMTTVLPNTAVLVSHTFVLTSPGQHVVSARLIPNNNVLLDPGSVVFSPVFTGMQTVSYRLGDVRYPQDGQRLEADIVFENLLSITSTAAVANVTLNQGEISRTQSMTLLPLPPQAKRSVTAAFDLTGLAAGQYSLTIALDGQKPRTIVRTPPGDLVIESIAATELSKAPVMIEAWIRNNSWLTVSQASLVIADRSQANNDYWRQEEISVALSALAPQETISLTVVLTRPLICEMDLDVRSPLIEDIDRFNNTFLMPGTRLCFVAGIEAASAPTDTLADRPQWQGVAPFTVYMSNTTNHTSAEWLWDFGDGITDTRRDPVSHTYTSPGTYILRLTALDPNSGGRSTASQLVSVYSPTLPIISCLGCDSATTGTAQEFSSNSEGLISDIYWDFGDNSITQTGNLVYHSYKQPGTYTVTLSVKGFEGDWRQAQMPVVVRSNTSHLTHRVFLPSVGLRATGQPTLTQHVYLPVVRRGQR